MALRLSPTVAGIFGPATDKERNADQAEEKDRREAENKTSVDAPSAGRLIQHASPNARRNPRSAQLGLQLNVVSSHSRSHRSAFAALGEMRREFVFFR